MWKSKLASKVLIVSPFRVFTVLTSLYMLSVGIFFLSGNKEIAGTPLFSVLDDFIEPRLWGLAVVMSAFGMIVGTWKRWRETIALASFVSILAWAFATALFLSQNKVGPSFVIIDLPALAFSIYIRLYTVAQPRLWQKHLPE